MRKPVIAGNWKMNMTCTEAIEYMRVLIPLLKDIPKKERDVVIAPPYTAGLKTREICFENGLIMRHVYDRMIISPPLIINESEIDELVSLAWKCLDLSMKQLKQEGLWS